MPAKLLPAECLARPKEKLRTTPAPFSLRLSQEERAKLERDAGDVPLGVYIRFRLFDLTATPRRTARRPSTDRQGLARVLAALGNSRLASNVNQLAKAANFGVLPVTTETEAELQAACSDIREMRAALMAALGLRAGGPLAGGRVPGRGVGARRPS